MNVHTRVPVRTVVLGLMASVLLLCGWAGAQTEGAAEGGESYSTFEESAGSVPAIDSFEVSDADVRSVFKMLSKHSGVDIVLSENVSGAVTLRLTNKTWQEIFLIVCRILRLEPVKEDTYFYVMTTEEYEAQLAAQTTGAVIDEKLAPLERHIIALSNTKAVAEALLGVGNVFRRTPKFKVTAATDRWQESSYRLPLEWLSLGEVALSLHSFLGAWLAAKTQRGETWSRSMPSTMRRRTINAAPLGTTERKAVTGVGEP